MSVKWKALIGKSVKEITYHFWVNRTNEKEPLEFLECVDLLLTNGERIYIKSNEEQSEVVEDKGFNLDEERKVLWRQFGENIALIPLDMTFHELWMPATYLKIADIRVQENGRELIFCFADHMICFEPIIEGLKVELYEDDYIG